MNNLRSEKYGFFSHTTLESHFGLKRFSTMVTLNDYPYQWSTILRKWILKSWTSLQRYFSGCSQAWTYVIYSVNICRVVTESIKSFNFGKRLIKQNKHFYITLCYAKIFTDVYKYTVITDCSGLMKQSTVDTSRVIKNVHFAWRAFVARK